MEYEYCSENDNLNSVWNCNVCNSENSCVDGECQFCECQGETCKRDNCSGDKHFYEEE